MAKAMALLRSTSQPTTIDTVATSTATLGTTIPGMETTNLFPSRSTNLITVFQGDPYIIVRSAIGDIEVYQLVSGTWGLVAGPYVPPGGHAYTPICLHVVNDTLVAMWSDVAGAGDGIRAAVSTDGSTWTALLTDGTTPVGSTLSGHSIVYRSAIWFTTEVGLWAFAPLARILGLAGVIGAFQIGETITGGVSGTTAVVRSFTGGSTLRVDTVSGSGFVAAELVTGGMSGATGTISTITRFVNATPDTGDDTGLGGATGPANSLGTFASWDGVLYFIQPETALGSTKLYQLNPAWQATDDVPAPQWTSLLFSGLSSVSFASIAADSGPSAMLFVNRNDELSLFYSGATGTKLAKTTSKVFPLTFTDLTNTLLPTELSSKTDVSVVLYADDRRRENNLHWFFLRDVSAVNTIVAKWDAVTAVESQGTLSGADYMLPAARRGEEATFTNLEPTVHITSVTQPFDGRVRIDYTVRSDSSSPVDVIPEYSIDGDEFFEMTQGDGDSGKEDLATSPAGTPYFFNWDAFADLDGDFLNMHLRIIARISGV